MQHGIMQLCFDAISFIKKKKKKRKEKKRKGDEKSQSTCHECKTELLNTFQKII